MHIDETYKDESVIHDYSSNQTPPIEMCLTLILMFESRGYEASKA